MVTGVFPLLLSGLSTTGDGSGSGSGSGAAVSDGTQENLSVCMYLVSYMNLPVHDCNLVKNGATLCLLLWCKLRNKQNRNNLCPVNREDKVISAN